MDLKIQKITKNMRSNVIDNYKVSYKFKLIFAGQETISLPKKLHNTCKINVINVNKLLLL